MIKALIFDYFGVIRPDDHGVMATYRRLGGDVEKDGVFIADLKAAANFGLLKDADAQIAERLGVSLETWYKEVGAHNNDPELLNFVIKQRAQGYKTGLLSNADSHMSSVFFEPGQLNTYFDAALFSGDVGISKPEAMFYRLIASKLEVEPEECIMIDDRPEFCAGARYVGMQSVEYKHFDQFVHDLAQILETENQVTES